MHLIIHIKMEILDFPHGLKGLFELDSPGPSGIFTLHRGAALRKQACLLSAMRLRGGMYLCFTWDLS